MTGYCVYKRQRAEQQVIAVGSCNVDVSNIEKRWFVQFMFEEFVPLIDW